MNQRDLAFLHDFVQFGLLHHVTGAEAFRRAYEEADSAAAAVREQVERVDPTTARDLAARLNDGARVQTICVARLLSELAAAIEDLGAMLHAIRHRDRRGVLAEYLGVLNPAVADALDMLTADPAPDLANLLRLPPITELADKLEPERLADATHDYESLSDTLRTAADIYRDRGPAGEPVAVGSAPADTVAVVLAVVDGVDSEARRGGLLAQAHNKIKHRFAVVEDIEALGASADGLILYAHYPRDVPAVKRLVHNITQVALVTAELAALLVTLAEHSLDAPPSRRPRPRRTATAASPRPDGETV